MTMMNPVYMRAYRRTRRHRWQAEGRCYVCGHAPEAGHKTCARCGERTRVAMRARRLRRRLAQQCTTCGGERDGEARTCAGCRAKERARKTAARPAMLRALHEQRDAYQQRTGRHLPLGAFQSLRPLLRAEGGL